MEQAAWELMIQRIYKQSIFIVVPLSLASIFFTGWDWRFSLSILIGGFVGMLNLRAIVWSVKTIFGFEEGGTPLVPQKAQTKMLVLSMFRLLIIFSILIILTIFKVIKVYGLLIGFTVVFIIIVKEGLIAAKKGD